MLTFTKAIGEHCSSQSAMPPLRQESTWPSSPWPRGRHTSKCVSAWLRGFRGIDMRLKMTQIQIIVLQLPEFSFSETLWRGEKNFSNHFQLQIHSFQDRRIPEICRCPTSPSPVNDLWQRAASPGSCRRFRRAEHGCQVQRLGIEML